MEDGSGKCLLDVISDPTALNEFLRSNSQLLIDAEINQPRTLSYQGSSILGQHANTLSTPKISNQSPSIAATIQTISSGSTPLMQQSINSTRSTVQNLYNSKAPVSLVNSSVTQTLVRNVNGSVAQSNSPRTSTPIKGNINSPINNLTSVTKGIALSPASNYQGKKPIPIQPKNPIILPSTSLPGAMNMHGKVRHGLVTQTPTSIMTNQLPMAQPGALPRGHSPGIINGVDASKTILTQLQTNRTVPQTVMSTPPKRIAPKQVLSPSSNSSLTMTSPVRLPQANIPTHNIQLATQLMKAGSAVQGSTVANQLYPQQMTTVVHQVANSNPATTMVQPSVAKTAQPVQQIQQLINEKLSTQQTQPAAPTQVQQKVFTQAQLQTALKQSQLIAQNSPGQQQNILVQQHILKQLIQQAQLAQQQKQLADKTTHLNVQPITTNTQAVVQQQKQVKQVVQTGQTGATTQQVTITNPVPGSSNQQIQLILPNQQVVTLTQNALSSNQQTVNVGQNLSRVNQASVNASLNTKSQIQLGVVSQANISASQPLMIVSQSGGNLVVHKNIQPGITTTAGTSASIPLQNLINQQQRQLINTTVQQQSQQQQVKLASNVLQVGQVKQIAQPTGTVLVHSQVANQGQSAVVAKQAISQQNVVIQTKPGITTAGGTTIQQLTPAQLQQLQNLGGVQKILIIKQPDVLQKLSAQGTKPQTIQITQQQLQAIQQMQSQLQSTPQKIIIQNKSESGVTSTTVLTAQQIKQLQQSLQQQGVSGKVVQMPQTVIQRQAIVQQLQNTKTTSKMAHLPRILQTSGRQTSSQVSAKTITTIKQEPNRGIKRTVPETPEPPKVVKRLKNALYQDQQGVSHPDIHTPFQSKVDAFNKLRCYHVYNDPGKTPADIEKAEILFNTVSSQLIKRSEKMMEKYRSLFLDESMRKEPSSEMVMLYRLYLADERAALAQDKKQVSEELKSLKCAPVPQPPAAPVTSVLKTTQTVTAKPQAIITPTVPSKPKTPPPVLENVKTPEKELDILNTNSLLSTPEEDLLQCDDDEESDVGLEENEIDKAVFNMESSSSYYEPLNHLSDSLMSDKLIDSPITNTSHTDADESAEELLLVDDDTEKEDVTATLALLHSMAEELDGNIT